MSVIKTVGWKEREGQWEDTYAQNLDLPLDFAHPRFAVDVSSPDELDGDLLSPLHMKAEFDFAKLTFS